MGFLLFASIVCVFFPSYYDFGQSQVVGLEEQNIFGMLWQVVKYSLNMICWGALLSIISCGLVSITQNIYIVLCVPFLLNYVAAHVLFNLKIYMFIILAVIFYYMGYKLWIKKYRGCVHEQKDLSKTDHVCFQKRIYRVDYKSQDADVCGTGCDG